ncbi:MAG: hypothetical protein ABI868_16075 [Acidobacteriota bacterium]
MSLRHLRRHSPIWIVWMICGTGASASATIGVPSAPGPIARAATREAGRLADERQEDSGAGSWSRVRRLAPGTGILVTAGDAPRGERYVLRVDESSLTVLNIAGVQLPAAVAAVLREVASTHPGYFSDAQRGDQFVLANGVRLRRDGVFAGDLKVADLEQVVEHIAGNDVVEIRTRKRGRGVWGHLGPLGGYFVGAMSGGVVAGLACRAVSGHDDCDSGAFLTGLLAGGIAGGVFGFHAANRETDEVIYRRPARP